MRICLFILYIPRDLYSGKVVESARALKEDLLLDCLSSVSVLCLSPSVAGTRGGCSRAFLLSSYHLFSWQKAWDICYPCPVLGKAILCYLFLDHCSQLPPIFPPLAIGSFGVPAIVFIVFVCFRWCQGRFWVCFCDPLQHKSEGEQKIQILHTGILRTTTRRETGSGDINRWAFVFRRTRRSWIHFPLP